ncbi:Na+/H+ antiporter subunit E [Ehrlichia muris]|uniref:Sodium:proton antiporter n=1 Tax=Ehrlichia muris AS145 TaxID=1423892 RepID=V9R5K0_9RICK|nr:Na+/H+ antiporter subunit E [Ehrlichia muris]AHC39007.1 sodium:proton antiporter [Ehrlichia muris AS145]
MKTFFTLFTFWFALSGYFDLFFVTLGIASCITTLVMARMLKNVIPLNDYDIYYTKKQFFPCMLHFLRYFFWIIQQVILSNIYITKKVWNFRSKIDSAIFRVIQTKQTTDLNISIVVNSITFTPGTVSINVIESSSSYKIRILAIDEDSMSGATDIDNKIASI